MENRSGAGGVGAVLACLRIACQNHSANPQFSSRLHVQIS